MQIKNCNYGQGNVAGTCQLGSEDFPAKIDIKASFTEVISFVFSSWIINEFENSKAM